MPIPTPEPGLVISYAYLWHHEHLSGAEEGRKNRPAVVTLVTRQKAGDALEVTVLPITHRAPLDPEWAIEIPQAVKRHLGLNSLRSWIVVAEGNEFLWPATTCARLPGQTGMTTGFCHHVSSTKC